MKTPARPCSIKLFKVLAIPAAMIICAALIPWTQTNATSPQTSSPPQTATYVPSISDFMIATIQPRHIRLWLAVQNRNWDFATYEVGNLRGAFNRLGRAHPAEHDLPLQDMIKSVTEQPFADLYKAIQSKDTTGFVRAYDDLTSGCNACHQGMNHGIVVIRVPQSASVPDQDFTQPAH